MQPVLPELEIGLYSMQVSQEPAQAGHHQW